MQPFGSAKFVRVDLLTARRETAIDRRMSDVSVDTRSVPTEDGWELELRRTVAPERVEAGRHPVLFVPGYGMNNFILGYHPRGTSLEASLARAGFEVWSVNMRGQGGARPARPSAPSPSIAGFVGSDVPAAVDAVLAATHTQTGGVVLAGCSLGGTVVYAYAGLSADERVRGLITIGGPLRWDETHPAVKLLYSSPWLAGRLHMKGARRLARIALPVAARLPGVLDLYMNRKQVDLSAASQMVNTVDDLYPRINEEIARWIGRRDLVLDGRNVTEAVGKLEVPLLLVLANRDGIVPPGAVLPARAAWGSDAVEVLNVGTDDEWYAHADLFISNRAPELVFDPLADWLGRVPVKA